MSYNQQLKEFIESSSFVQIKDQANYPNTLFFFGKYLTHLIKFIGGRHNS
jgi:hypothetical protein